ncbi:hypothetical protein BDV95DRAFT_273992 [Massariosphaeria phaeospora]|uniref:Uncharacterized protein n=1 Tax=Massariosphaeria phaeospora TaxID=100035 RepID=A0A7C8IG14_9PLEO|nr:hypothetical protein BDV95DRAFT_273992 [Massariosphaeria phaeospora]
MLRAWTRIALRFRYCMQRLSCWVAGIVAVGGEEAVTKRFADTNSQVNHMPVTFLVYNPPKYVWSLATSTACSARGDGYGQALHINTLPGRHVCSLTRRLFTSLPRHLKRNAHDLQEPAHGRVSIRPVGACLSARVHYSPSPQS